MPGRVLVNDVSGGLADPEMAALVAERGVPFVAMHWRGHSADMQDRARYDDVVADVRRELGERVEALVAAGIRPDDIVLDPGLGLRQAGRSTTGSCCAASTSWRRSATGCVLGASRKRFLGLVGRTPATERPPLARDVATAATTPVCRPAGGLGGAGARRRRRPSTPSTSPTPCGVRS